MHAPEVLVVAKGDRIVSSRTILAFLIAPISFGFLLAILTAFSGTISIVIVGLAVVVGYPIALILGLPTYLLLQRIGAKGPLTYCVMGAVAAAILVGNLVIWPVYVEHDGDLSSLFLVERLRQMGILSFGGFFTVAVFWLIARPDRAEPSGETSDWRLSKIKRESPHGRTRG